MVNYLKVILIILSNEKLFYEAKELFYEHYKNNKEAQDYFFEWTD
jgi:hypothetical protein